MKAYVKINYDRDGVYQEGTIMEASELLQDYKDGLIDGEPNDEDFKRWLDEVSEPTAIEMIANFWGLDYEFV